MFLVVNARLELTIVIYGNVSGPWEISHTHRGELGSSHPLFFKKISYLFLFVWTRLNKQTQTTTLFLGLGGFPKASLREWVFQIC